MAACCLILFLYFDNNNQQLCYLLTTYIVQLAEQAVSAARIPSCHPEVIALTVAEAVLAVREQAQVTIQRGEDCITLLAAKHPWLVKLL